MVGYRNAIYNAKEQTFEVFTWAETGERVSYVSKFNPYVYIEDSKGADLSIFNTKIRKKSFNTYFDKLKWIKETGTKRLFENFNPVQQSLIDMYGDYNDTEDFVKFPLKIYFFDIEAVAPTGMGFPSPENAAYPINLINVFDSIDEIYYVWGTGEYKPKQKNIKYFNCATEIDLLTSFIEFIRKNPPDILSGWNCINKEQHIWLEDRITSIGNISKKTENTPLKLYGNCINRYMDTGIKDEYCIENEFGFNVLSSIDHKFMVMVKPKHKYKNKNTFLKLPLQELSVSNIIELQANNDVYSKVCLTPNKNNNLTYRQLITKNLDTFLNSTLLFDFYITDCRIRDKLKNNIQLTQLIRADYWWGAEFWKGRSNWRWSFLKDYIDRQDIVSFLETTQTLLFTQNKHATQINLDEEISPELLQFIGFLFTDGTLDKIKKADIIKPQLSVRLCNKYENVISQYTEIHRLHTDVIDKRAVSGPLKTKDGCYYKQFGLTNKIGLLLPLIYNNQLKKQPNIELLSQLSYCQFTSLYAGMIDGDGCIDTGVDLCNFDCVQYNFLNDLQELLLWNNVISCVRPSKNTLHIYNYETNRLFLQKISCKMFQKPRKQKIDDLKYFTKLQTISKDIKYVYNDTQHEYIVRLKPVTLTGNKVEMCDIETDTHLFICNGILTHNCTFFDIPYIVNRIRNMLGSDAVNDLSTANRVYPRTFMNKFGQQQVQWYIEGISCVDYLDIYKRFCLKNRESYRLDFIGETELAERKVDIGDKDLYQLMQTDWNTFVDYNIQDVNLLVKLEVKLQYISLLRMLAYMGLTTFEAAMGTLSVITGASAIRARKNNLHISTFIRTAVEGKNPGAFVAEPQKGFQKNIVSFDANSLYPNVMISLNMSPETKVGKIIESDEESITIRHVNGQIFKLTREKFVKYLKTEDIAVSKAKILFAQKTKGIMPDLVDFYYTERKKVQAELKKCKNEEAAIKEELKAMELT